MKKDHNITNKQRNMRVLVQLKIVKFWRKITKIIIKNYLNNQNFYVIFLMQYLKNIIIALTILLGLITFAQSETSWIKKKDKTETVKKVEKEKTTSWIKKKEVKENKKKVKKKIKKSKSWITKKVKKKLKILKKN